ncbi:hypothetical protein [Leptolyngbya sp. PCC 6406]|uniref:hypothetical protein n=1 Tax=Leptolyngbya sp. PCC 6406 TaxID=1173264 RepID=UPI0002ABC55D|nr:hypothetical protein [Leptolyngbya sp. PCC 6406]
MNSLQLRQTINHYLDQLSGDRLRLVADFLDFLVHTEHQEQAPASESPAFRPPTGGSLLSHTETWAGEDFEDCLERVYETRSQLRA